MNRIRHNPRHNPNHNYNQKVLSVDRVARVVKGGRRFRFRALVVLGDGKGLLGIGSAKGADFTSAINKAADVAKKSMKRVVLSGQATIPHDVTAKVGGAHILLKPAKEGTGLIAGSVTRDILEAAGYHNIYSKSLGNSNKTNLAYAVIRALGELVPPEEWHLNRLKAAAAVAEGGKS
ncbi:30S ribosomal protein S5 [Candidatus Saccharibacteria bacterium]|nr:30S ribosomal protein S5 [Candidatus Saccharibacteria bacterium]